MKTGARPRSIGKRRGENIDSLRLEHLSHLRDALAVCAISAADQESRWIEPDEIAGLGCARRSDRRKRGNAQITGESGMVLSFRHTVCLPRSHHDQSEVGGER